MKKAPIWLTLIVIVLLGVSFALGTLFAKPQWQEAKEAATPIDVWASVEERVVSERVELSGQVVAPTEKKITLSHDGVVTAPAAKPGQTLVHGQRICELSGKPYFALPPPLALYRDLREGNSGEDVKSLQKSLAAAGFTVTVSGYVDWATVSALTTMFRDAEYWLPTEDVPATAQTTAPSTDTSASTAPQTPSAATKPKQRVVIPHEQLVATPSGIITTAAALGTKISGEDPVATTQSGEKTVVAQVPVDTADQFTVGQSVTYSASSTSFTGTVITKGAFKEGKEGVLPGYPITISLKPADAKKLTEGDNVLVSPATSADKSGLAVPISAIRHDHDGSYVLTPSEEEQHTRTPVSIQRTANGWAAVTGVKVGDKVLVS